MKTIKSDLDAIEEVRKEIAVSQQKKKALLDKFSKDHAPYKVGDIAVVKGFSHNGKQCVIDDIWMRTGYSRTGWEWRIRAKVLKNDGTTSKLISIWSEDLPSL